MPALSIDSPVGRLTVTETDGAITAVDWNGNAQDETELLVAARDQLHQYFGSGSHVIDLPVRVAGSTFLTETCAAMSATPAGEPRTYGEIARNLGVSAQAAGQGCGANPVPIIIPCHRVLAGNGVGGYSGDGGVERKIELLKLEGGFPFLI